MTHAGGRLHGSFTSVLALALLPLSLPAAVHALNPPVHLGNFAHTSWTSRDGYSLGGVFAMAQTQDGYLWLASETGLVRFDGEKFKPWQPPAGQRLPNNPYSLLVARDGTLWMGTYSGLASWDGAELVTHPETNNGFVTSLIEDRNGTIWAGVIAGKGGELCEIRKEQAKCHGREGQFGTFVWSLAEDAAGNLWVGAATGLWRWTPGTTERLELPDRVGDLVSTEHGLLIGIRGAGLMRLVGGRLRSHDIRRAEDPREKIPGLKLKSNKLLRDREGGLWIGADGEGLFHVQDGLAEHFNTANGLAGDIACSLFEDREGNIWFASEKGLDRFRKLSVSTLWVGKGPHSEISKSVLASADGSVWVAASAGVTRWQGDGFRYFGVEDGLPATGGQALFEDPRGRIWVSTYGGLAFFDRGRFVKVEGQPGNDVVSLAGDENNLWVSGPGDLARFQDDRRVDTLTWNSLGNGNRGNSLAHRGGVWLGITGEGVLFFKDGKVQERYSAADGLGAGHVASLRLDGDGALWAATHGGLSRIKDGRVRTMTIENGLPCDTMHWSIEDDQQVLWMYTTCGLVRVSREDVGRWIEDPAHIVDTRRWGAADGVPIRAVSPYYSPPVTKAADGKLWFVSGEGIQVVDPAHLSYNRIPPPVYIEQIVADREPYPVESGVRLPPLVRDVTLEFTALSLVDAQSVSFRYRLDGQDEDWQEAGNRRQALYMNLRPGQYRFHVRASNNNGVWNEQGAQLDFTIAPAWYQTLWFRLAWVVLIAGLIWAGVVLHTRKVRREENRLRSVIEGIPTMAFSVHPDGSIDLVNQQWLDYSGDSAGGRNWQSAIHPADVDAHVAKWRAALASGEPFENEVRFRSAKGEYRWFLVRAVPLRDTQGRIVKWHGALTDIEERRRAEEERERLRQLEAQLAHTNRVSMLGELTASIAHEINQPIGAAIASAGAGLRWLDRDEPALDRARESFLRIKDDSKRAADIITGLRALYRKETSPQRELLDLNEVIREMLVLLRREAVRHSVVMRTELAPSLPKVRANRVQMQQVLMNLMVNGIEAMKAGGELLIRTRASEEGIQVTVKDSGEGIPAGEIENIFNAFVTTKAAGSGMGLAISRTIVESHDGKLWAEPQPGPGATFSFTLPAATAGQPQNS